MAIKPIEHVEIGLDRTTYYFKTKEDYLKLLKMFLVELEEVSDALTELSKIKDLDTVTGVWLDYIGKIVGEQRRGREDSLYRKALQLRIAINTSDGTAPVIYEILKTYTESDKIRVAEGILSYGQIILNGTENVDLSLWELIQEIQPATVRALVLQDTDNKCFFPAYEWKIANIERFEVVTDTVTETLELVLSLLTPPVPFFVSTTDEEATYDPDTEGMQFLEWEDVEYFYLNTGEIFEVVIDGEVKPFSVEIGSTEPANKVLLPWEITDETINIKVAPTVVETYVSGVNYTVMTKPAGVIKQLESKVDEEI